MYEKKMEKYRDRLFGLIDEDRILCTEIPRPSKKIIDDLKGIKGLASTVSDVLDSIGVNGAIAASTLQPLQQNVTVVGPVVTLRYVIERLTPTQGFVEQRKGRMADRDAYAVASPGDVVVFDMGGKIISGQGGMSTAVAIKTGIAATICDGGVRDVEEIREQGLPVWARGFTPVSGKFRIEAAAINGPVLMDGIQVCPGDLCVADDTGICFIPVEKIEEVYRRVMEIVKREETVMKAFHEGGSIEEILKILPASKW